MAGAAGHCHLCFGLRTSEGKLSLDAERTQPPCGNRRAGQRVLVVTALASVACCDGRAPMASLILAVSAVLLLVIGQPAWAARPRGGFWPCRRSPQWPAATAAPRWPRSSLRYPLSCCS